MHEQGRQTSGKQEDMSSILASCPLSCRQCLKHRNYLTFYVCCIGLLATIHVMAALRSLFPSGPTRQTVQTIYLFFIVTLFLPDVLSP